jgi:hypothetical protein
VLAIAEPGSLTETIKSFGGKLIPAETVGTVAVVCGNAGSAFMVEFPELDAVDRGDA